jgi:DNA-directed RNA polymerase subunit RPC12/RpoP
MKLAPYRCCHCGGYVFLDETRFITTPLDVQCPYCADSGQSSRVSLPTELVPVETAPFVVERVNRCGGAGG